MNAERIASQTVVHFLATSDPHFLKTAREFFLRKEMDACRCGVRVEADYPIADAENIEAISTGRGSYLVLESSVMGDYDRYADTLLSFALGNGMVADKSGLFAVYDAKKSFDNPSITMYCPVKVEKKR
jgi:hypothetical protein